MHRFACFQADILIFLILNKKNFLVYTFLSLQFSMQVLRAKSCPNPSVLLVLFSEFLYVYFHRGRTQYLIRQPHVKYKYQRKSSQKLHHHLKNENDLLRRIQRHHQPSIHSGPDPVWSVCRGSSL